MESLEDVTSFNKKERLSEIPSKIQYNFKNDQSISNIYNSFYKNEDKLSYVIESNFLKESSSEYLINEKKTSTIHDSNCFFDQHYLKNQPYQNLFKISKFSVIISKVIPKENIYYDPSEHVVKHIIAEVETNLKEKKEYIVLFNGGYKAKVNHEQIVKYHQGAIALQDYKKKIDLLNEELLNNDSSENLYYSSDDIPIIEKLSHESLYENRSPIVSPQKALNYFSTDTEDDIFISSEWKNIGLGEVLFSKAKINMPYDFDVPKKKIKEYKKKLNYKSQIRRSNRNKNQTINYREDKYESSEDILSSEQYKNDTFEVPLKTLKRDKKSEIMFFPILNDFMDFHKSYCEKCGGNKDLIPCQGCSIVYHQDCMGSKANRVVVLTLIDGKGYIFHCYYCMELKKSFKLRSRCYVCGKIGKNCVDLGNISQKDSVCDNVFKSKKKEDDTGFILNNSKELLWRCNRCYRACHFYHLPERLYKDEKFKVFQVENYIKSWTCDECIKYPYHIDKILGWRLSSNNVSIDIAVGEENIDYSEWYREYLVKFKAQSYLRVTWVSGLWLSGISKIKNYFDFQENISIKTIQDAVPEDYCTIDVIFDVIYNNGQSRNQKIFKSKEEELEAINNVDKVLCKWKGLEYTDVTWENVPKYNSSRWDAFKNAYTRFVESQYIHSLSRNIKLSKIMKNIPFSDLEIKNQPKYIQGGELMKYQKEGLNWLYYMCQKGRSVILADEMGLGKTIQIISLCSVLFHKWEKWPFLIVAPNSTISNWKREFSKWSPYLHVVPYHGEKIQRDIVRQYQLFHQQSSRDLKCHVVLTSYHTIITDSILGNFDWECLIVDEGQRLKNEHSLLFKKLTSYKSQNRIILTGTPLQNNVKELFSLLQFLEPEKFDATKLSLKYLNMTSEKVSQMHDILRPLLLRRTKLDVLKSLPQKLEIILPVTMSSLQKSLYKLILSKNAKLLMSIMSKSVSERPLANYNNTALSNILLQLRKVLSHPYVYNPNVEEKTSDEQLEYERMVKASAKLEFLSKLFPKLKKRGRRVLIFCQFTLTLDILEDWLNYMGYKSERIDGRTPTYDRQRRIDEFNAKGSELFCFLLSTRAGGVGINLATADTIIIYDVDFNPHQDIQAISRSYRIGQTKNVLVFILITRNTAEEKILEGARRKMVLDHLIIESMDEKNETNIDYQSILSFGAKSLFEDQNKDQEISYNDNEIENLLIQSENDFSKEINRNTVDSFSFAKVWESSMNKLDKSLDNHKLEDADIDFWDKIVNENNSMEDASEDLNIEVGMRGRKRKKINYSLDGFSTTKSQKFKKKTKTYFSSSSDTEFYENIKDSPYSNESADHINKPKHTTSNKISRDGTYLRMIDNQSKINANRSAKLNTRDNLKSQKCTNTLKKNKEKEKKIKPITNPNIIVDISKNVEKKASKTQCN
ncbi:hypothetical protein PORY_002128 [Pneumocystis oryctolagi]|uniref:Uncharacterized protein n=1 Tax=Pneumocystis oryctolagi TaxID=42067 RepID=A0ACB7CBW2_9ASCO|nr:hypothetical protein PORY_002128 [Pneumocystis oryctolagi]